MRSRITEALSSLVDAGGGINEAERKAKGILMEVLAPVGEHGVTVEPLGRIDDGFIVLAEEHPFQFKPITLVRYNKIKYRLEVFVSEWEKENESIDSEGKWIWLEDAHTDIHFLIDRVIENLEYADYYDEEEN